MIDSKDQAAVQLVKELTRTLEQAADLVHLDVCMGEGDLEDCEEFDVAVDLLARTSKFLEKNLVIGGPRG